MGIGIFVAVAGLMWAWYDYHKGKQLDKTNDESSSRVLTTIETKQMEQTKTRELFLKTLTEIGCQYTIDDDDNRIYFSYQGENFVVDAADEKTYICIWDMFWGSVELYDIDELSRLKKAINGANLNFGLTTVYTVNEEGSTVDVHCRSVVLFIPQIPQPDNYLRTELNEFFHVHRFVENELAKLRSEEEKLQSR
mgnify:CR=1 FL=1